MNEASVRFWGRCIGVLEDVEVRGPSIKVRVKIDINNSLLRGIRVFMEEIGKEVSLQL